MAASLGFTTGAVCSGGNHIVVGYVINGNAGTLHIDIDEARLPMTRDEVDQFAKTALRIIARQVTKAQMRAAIRDTVVNLTAVVT